MRAHVVLAIFMAAVSIATWAAPAPWYRWRSPNANYDICAQNSPGDDWIKVKGPYEDAHCQKLGTPGNGWR